MGPPSYIFVAKSLYLPEKKILELVSTYGLKTRLLRNYVLLLLRIGYDAILAFEAVAYLRELRTFYIGSGAC